MALSLDIVDPILHRGWDDLLVSSPDSSVFHSSGWARVLSGSYGYIPRYFASFQAGKIFALLPVMEVNSLLTGRRGISLPFSDYCDPLVPAGIPLESLMAQIIDHAGSSGWKTLEIRCRNGRLKGTLPSSSRFWLPLPVR